QGAHAEALPVRHGAARVRRLALAARAARARHAPACDARGARRDPCASEQARAGVAQMSPMNAYLADWLPLIQSLGWTLLHFLWQGAVIAAGYAAVRLLVPADRAEIRYSAGLLALALIALCPPLTLAIVYPNVVVS